MFKKVKEFEKQYSTLFFCISLLIIIVFLAYFSVLNKDKEDECVVPNKLVNNYTNYSYNVSYEKDNKIVKLNIKRYDKKYLIEKEENDIKESYYIYYTDVLKKDNNGEYRVYNKNIIDGLNNKLLFIDYINDVSLQSNITTDNELTCYVNRKLDISMCVNLDKSITLKGDDYRIIYEVESSGEVADFNVNANYEEIIEEEPEVENNIVQ